ncbi:hypothetical protein RF55_23139, partial [Lasius niger]
INVAKEFDILKGGGGLGEPSSSGGAQPLGEYLLFAY